MANQAVYKRVTILLSFLAYSLTLVHSLVPHHHHGESKVNHHPHGNEKSHHHHEQDEENKSVSHVFADAIHHPASSVVIHPQSENLQKKCGADEVIIFTTSQLIFHELKPPDIPIHLQERHFSSNEDSFFLLRAPPVA